MTAANGSGNGRVTLRDVMHLQREMYEKIEAINLEITTVKIKVAVISALVSVATSVAVAVLASFIRNGAK